MKEKSIKLTVLECKIVKEVFDNTILRYEYELLIVESDAKIRTENTIKLLKKLRDRFE
jgi:hypothetical protein